MGLLNKLEQKLYHIEDKDEKSDAQSDEGIQDNEKKEDQAESNSAEMKKWEAVPEDSFSRASGWWSRNQKNFKIIIISILSALFVSAILVFIFRDSYFVRTYIFREIFSEKGISLEVDIPKKVKGGKEAVYVVKVNNATGVALKDAELSLIRPKDFKMTSSADDSKMDRLVWTMGDVASKNNNKVEFKGVINTKKVDSRVFDFELKYRPANMSSVLTKKISYTVEIEDSAINLILGVPDEVVIGRQVSYTIDCINDGDASVSDLELRVEYPEGFSFLSSDPSPFKDNNIWKIDVLSKSELYQISIQGVLNGKEMQTQPLRVMVGRDTGSEFEVFKEELMSSTLISSPLVLSQHVNDEEIYNANAGEILDFVINYKNDTSLTINNIRLMSIIDDKNSVFDLSSLTISDGGKYDGNSKTITWQVSDKPDLAILAKGAEGEVSFSVKIKQYLPISSFKDKNFVISNKVIMSGANIPVSIGTIENSMVVKINSKLIFSVAGYHIDAKLGGFGPIPPKVGETSSFSLHFGLMNLANDLSDVSVEASLPGNIEWTGQTSCQLGKLEYNEMNRKITWRIGTLGAGIGFVLPREECIFQVKVTPQVNQAGENITLLKDIKASAKDTFTGVNLTAQNKDFTVEEIQDAGSNYLVEN